MIAPRTRRWIGALGLVALGGALALGSVGCSAHAARPYERERLADRIMSFKAEAKEEARKVKTLESREGSTGGNGGAGGGCACN